MQDDVRKYPAKEDVAFMRGAAGGFAGGERGVQQFVQSGSLSPADEARSNKLKATKDAALVLGLLVLSAAGTVGLAKLGLVDVQLPTSASPAQGQGTVPLQAAGSGGAAAGAAADVAQQAAVQLDRQTAGLTALQKNVLLAGGGVGGAVLLAVAVRSGLTAAAEGVGNATKKVTVQALVLGAAAAMGYYLLSQ